MRLSGGATKARDGHCQIEQRSPLPSQLIGPPSAFDATFPALADRTVPFLLTMLMSLMALIGALHQFMTLRLPSA